MLSLGKVATGAAAASYYEEADDYYHQDSAPSAWHGAGATALGLAGTVDAERFRDLLDGKMPDGSQLHNAAEGRRGGTDFTFSAPKSVSLQALAGGDTRLIDAHERAVSRAMAYAETLAGYRNTVNGQTERLDSAKLVVASFRHDLSRACDPNLHTHAVVINATQRPDGQWRALEQSAFYQQQKLIGALYRAELALEVQRLGYEVRLTHTDGRFELAHMSARQIDAFSQRSQAIEEALARQGKTREQATAKEKETIALATRAQKVDVDRQQLREQWQSQSRELGLDYRRPEAGREPERSAALAVAYAMAHCGERQAVMSEAQLIRAALEHGTGRTDLATIRQELAQQVAAGTLIRQGERYTTAEAQTRERQLLDIEARGRGAVAPIHARGVAEALAGTALNPGQRDAAALIVSTEHRITAVQGLAGTGKTTMLREAQQLATGAGYQVLGLAPSAAAARELGKAGCASQTLASFQAKTPELNARTLLVVDEAGMVSTRDMLAVLAKAEAAGARVVLVGDTQQLKAVEAGKPFAQLQAAGMARVDMGEIQRQQPGPLKQAVELAAQGQVERSLQVLSAHIREIDQAPQRYQHMARDYVAQSRDGAGVLMVAGTHVARDAINQQVRVELGLAGHGLNVTTLDRRDLTAAQAASSLSYQAGDLVQAGKAYAGLGLERGDTARVIEAGGGRVTLERADGAQVSWRPAQQAHLTAYRVTERELALGDVVRVTANDASLGLVNGERATVVAVDAERASLTLTTSSGRTVDMDAGKPMHLDHGYCSTIHAAQGQTADRVLIEADTRSATANESAYYVAISRAREGATVYTDDRQALPEVMARSDEKSAALDVKREEHGMER